MSKDDFDLFRHLRPIKPNSALDLINGLGDRQYGSSRRRSNSKENVELFAEEQFVRKADYEEMRCEMPGLPRSTFLMVFSPDCTRVASTHGNHNIYVTDLRSGKNIRTLIGHPRTPWCIAFHPTSNQIIASGCLGGQVRIWDLSGGSEVWTTSNHSVIASIAFHPNDRVLAIATYNEVYFWDWSRPEPFVHATTSNPKEKVRYVAFDKLGHKLITGIANSPQTRWERVRAPVPVPRQELCASPYRRRITQRLVNTMSTPQPNNTQESAPERESLSDLLRERRIAVCYRNLVREYEQLVHRYLQLYRPPTMIDRGTDPMEPGVLSSNTSTSGTQTPEPSTSGTQTTSGAGTATSNPSQPNTSHNRSLSPQPGPSNADSNSTPSTSASQPSSRFKIVLSQPTNSQATTSQNLITPSRIFCVVKKPNTLIRGTQTSEMRKHKADQNSQDMSNEKKFKKDNNSEEGCSSSSQPADNQNAESGSSNATATDAEQQLNCSLAEENERKVLVVSLQRLPPEHIPVGNSGQQSEQTAIPSGANQESQNSRADFHFNQRMGLFHRRRYRNRASTPSSSSSRNDLSTSEEALPGDVEDDLPTHFHRERNISTAENGNNENPLPQNNQRNVDELLSNIRRTAEEEVRNRILPIIRSVPPNERPELIRLFENSREHVRMRLRRMYPMFLKRNNRRPLYIDSSSDNTSSDDEQSSPNRPSQPNMSPPRPVNFTASIPDIPTASNNPNTNISSNFNLNSSEPSTSSGGRPPVRNFNTELEQLVTTLLTEIERNEAERSESNSNTSPSRNHLRPAFHPLYADTSMSAARTEPFNFDSALPAQNSSPPSSSGLNDFLLDVLFGQTPRSAANDAVAGPSNSSRSPTTIVNTNTRTTNSTIYTTSNSVPRRRCFSHRVSAFMPTRVRLGHQNTSRYRRSVHYPWCRGRTAPRLGHLFPDVFALEDEIINFSERENSEDDPPQWSSTPNQQDVPLNVPPFSPENNGVWNMYSNIVQDLESSLNDVRNIRASSRPWETSDMLSSFSERLDNIMTQSDTILRNLRSSLDMLQSRVEPNRPQESEPNFNYNDPGFYIRDLRTDSSNVEPTAGTSDSSSNAHDLFSPSRAVAADHTYPRNTDSGNQQSDMSPLMTSLHFTISHIRRQARLLRQQVESIQRIDRAMLEVAQLQTIKQLIIELIRHVRTLSGENRTTGVSSVRQMMAGTRISDSSPYDSPSDDYGANSQPLNLTTSQQNNVNPSMPSTSSGTTSEPTTNRPRSSTRKTYPPSRLSRLARNSNSNRHPSLRDWLSVRYLSHINYFNRHHTSTARQTPPSRPPPPPPNRPFPIFESSRPSTSQESNRPSTSQEPTSPSANNHATNIDSAMLIRMANSLGTILTSQVRYFTNAQDNPRSSGTSATVDFIERALALRLHGSLRRMNRVLGTTVNDNMLVNWPSDALAVTLDGALRYGARNTLSLVVDRMSRHVELNNSDVQQSLRRQFHAVLAMSFLLTELLLLQVVDSIPPPSGLNLDPERESLTNRIDQMCTDMLQRRFGDNSYQLTRSLRLMKLTMRHAYTVLTRRNAMLPRPETDRRQLIGSINRCLRTINSRPQNTQNNPDQSTPSDEANFSPDVPNEPGPSTSSNTNANDAWYSTVNDLITRYSDNRDDEVNQPSTSGTADRAGLSSNNDNSDADVTDEEPDWYRGNSNPSSHNSNLYRTNNVNLAPNSDSGSSRPWNVPSVHVNDVPVSEQPPVFAQRNIPHRQRFSERVSELRSNRAGLFRPRFLHPLYASVNPFDADLDDPQREQPYDVDMITTVTPNHRIQAWDISDWCVPSISNSIKNIVVSECKIHNDASVDIAQDGTILVTLLPSGGYLNVTNRLGVYSLRWETLGQCLYTTSFEQNAVSVSLSPLSRHLVVGLASRRVSIAPSDRWVMARIFKIEQTDVPGDRLPVLRELEQTRESRINCIRWLPHSGQGLIYATNTGQLVIIS